MKNEAMPNYWYPANAPHISEKLFNDGGQNRTCAAVNLGFDSSEYHVACGGDATAAYPGEKSREAVRQFVFIKPDYFVVYDRVTSVSVDQQKVFLLHTDGKPAAVAPGIWRSENQQGSLFTRTLLPVKLNSEIIGGPGNEFFTGGKNRNNITRHTQRCGCPFCRISTHRSNQICNSAKSIGAPCQTIRLAVTPACTVTIGVLKAFSLTCRLNFSP
jgi:hypothetical protein